MLLLRDAKISHYELREETIEFYLYLSYPSEFFLLMYTGDYKYTI